MGSNKWQNLNETKILKLGHRYLLASHRHQINGRILECATICSGQYRTHYLFPGSIQIILIYSIRINFMDSSRPSGLREHKRASLGAIPARQTCITQSRIQPEVLVIWKIQQLNIRPHATYGIIDISTSL